MNIDPEIRSKISQLDGLAEEIREYLEEHEDGDNYTEICMELKDTLEVLQDNITSFQEEQGWI